MKYILSFTLSILLLSCSTKREKVDTIYYNGVVYTVDSSFSIQEAFAIKDGQFVATGTTENIQSKYDAEQSLNLNGKSVFPGFYDAHCHFLGYGLSLQQVNLVGTKSFKEVIERVLKFAEENPDMEWITGRGWDQNDWEVKEYPDNNTLNQLFPNRPVAIRRIDGHGLLANQKAIELSKIQPSDTVDGIELNNGAFSGIFIDNAADVILQSIPVPSRKNKIDALLKAQQNCFEVGLTTVDDAGLPLSDVLLIDSLQKTGDLKMNIYAMLEPSDENFDFAKNGYYQTNKLNVRSFKVYADGALGSRGACLKDVYTDKPEHRGFMINSHSKLNEIANKIYQLDYQMNTHCIGDSANKTLLHIYGNELKGENEKRWRIEHAQIMDSSDIELFAKYDIIPSVQPTHCTSDMYWAEDRVGTERIKYAYAYKTLLYQNGLVAAGSDFPIESINPLFGFYAAVSRKDQESYPDNGFQIKDALTREEALKAMTIWAAYSNFEENEKGSIEIGKKADFVVLNNDIMKIEQNEIFKSTISKTVLDGNPVYHQK